MHRVPVLLLVTTTVLNLCTPFAQVRFDVASVRENTRPDGVERLRRTPDGGVTAEHFQARFLITIAYQLQPFQLVGAPGWANEAFYDITAKPAAGSGTTLADMNAMLQALMVERFGLRFHRENRAMDGFALVPVKKGTLGPAMKVSAIDCEQTPALPQCRTSGNASNAFVVSGAPMWTLLQRLVAEVNAPVDDVTGLTGVYDINLRWASDPTATGDLPSLFTGLQEQLGLKLERRRVTAEVFVVDRFERPAPD
jgi:uncharacterized protein (TIGR03435 family)